MLTFQTRLLTLIDIFLNYIQDYVHSINALFIQDKVIPPISGGPLSGPLSHFQS